MDAHTLSFILLSFHTLIALVHPLHGNPYSLTLISIDGHLHSPSIRLVDVRLSSSFLSSPQPPFYLLGSMVGCVGCNLKFSYAQNNQEHATGDGSQFVTTRHVVPCSGRRVGAARPRGSSPSCLISLEQPVVRSLVQVRQSGASAPPLTVSAHAGGTSCGRLLGPITQPAASGGVYSQHMQTLVTAPKRSIK